MTDRVSLRDINESVSRLEDKVDHRLERLEQRMDKQEDSTSRLTGVVSAISLISGAFFTWLWKKIGFE